MHALENGKLNVQDYDITSDWLEILHDDYQRRDEASPTSVVFLRWGQHSLPAIIEENGQGLTEGFMERSFYYMISEFDEFKIEGRIEENKAMIRALEQRQLQSRMGRGQQCWSSPWASPASSRTTARFHHGQKPLAFFLSQTRSASSSPILSQDGEGTPIPMHIYRQKMANQAGYVVCILSLDVAAREEKGDLHHPDSQN